MLIKLLNHYHNNYVNIINGLKKTTNLLNDKTLPIKKIENFISTYEFYAALKFKALAAPKNQSQDARPNSIQAKKIKAIKQIKNTM